MKIFLCPRQKQIDDILVFGIKCYTDTRTDEFFY